MIKVDHIEGAGIFFIETHRKNKGIPGMFREICRDQDLLFHRYSIDFINILKRSCDKSIQSKQCFVNTKSEGFM